MMMIRTRTLTMVIMIRILLRGFRSGGTAVKGLAVQGFCG